MIESIKETLREAYKDICFCWDILKNMGLIMKMVLIIAPTLGIKAILNIVSKHKRI